MTTIDTRAKGRTAVEVLAWSRDFVRPALQAASDRLPPSVRPIIGYHFGWQDEDGNETAGDSGKLLRPALVLVSAECVGADPAAAVAAAAAVEFVHNFSLLHDDVMDGDVTRRHRPTAWAVFGAGAAILAGDALLTLALETLAEAPQAMRVLSAAVNALVDGQIADVAFETRTDVELAECLRMAQAKTGALLGASCALGAMSGGGTAEQIERLTSFGRNLGLAFQHVDDLLGIWGDTAATGKPIYSDLHNRKKSLPVVAALTSGTAAGEELTVLYEQEGDLTDAELVRAAELIDISGAREWSQTHADELLERALNDLVSANPAPVPGSELGALAKLATHRDR
jgi:geranylgeranyl diphosphate synthase type I